MIQDFLAKLKQSYNKISLAEKIVFAAILSMLLFKAFLVTDFTRNNFVFLSNYQHVFSDSYDWVANGVRLFQNDGISYRNPGLVLIIKLLYSAKLLLLLPFIGNLAFFVAIVFIYKTCRMVAGRNLSLALAVILSLNFSLNLSANSILADIYAVAFIATSFYYLLTKRYFLTYFWLGISILFQNLGYFMLPIWAAYYAVYHKNELINKLKKKNYRYFIEGGFKLAAVLTPVWAWNLYKFIKFGNPMYSKVAQLELLRPNFDSVDFYLFNGVAMFGFALIALGAYWLIHYKKLSRNKVYLWAGVGVMFNFLQWVIAYDWDDKRFLVYFTPFLFPLIAGMLSSLKSKYWVKNWVKVLVLIALFYTSILPTTTFLANNEIPLVNNKYLEVVGPADLASHKVEIRTRDGYDNPMMNLNPIIYGSLAQFRTNRAQGYNNIGGSQYANYSHIIDVGFKDSDMTICMPIGFKYRKYLLRSTFMINKNINLEKVKINENCGPEIK